MMGVGMWLHYQCQLAIVPLHVWMAAGWTPLEVCGCRCWEAKSNLYGKCRPKESGHGPGHASNNHEHNASSTPNRNTDDRWRHHRYGITLPVRCLLVVVVVVVVVVVPRFHPTVARLDAQCAVRVSGLRHPDDDVGRNGSSSSSNNNRHPQKVLRVAHWSPLLPLRLRGGRRTSRWDAAVEPKTALLVVSDHQMHAGFAMAAAETLGETVVLVLGAFGSHPTVAEVAQASSWGVGARSLRHATVLCPFRHFRIPAHHPAPCPWAHHVPVCTPACLLQALAGHRWQQQQQHRVRRLLGR